MIKIGITGSISSGKTIASKILSKKRGPLFSADNEVKRLYQNKNFRQKLIKNFNIKNISKKNKNKKTLFYEIPLLIESRLMKFFDVIIFIKAKKKIRLKRFKLKGGDKNLFIIMNKKQLPDLKKMKFCDHVVVNEKNLSILKSNLLDIIKAYV